MNLVKSEMNDNKKLLINGDMNGLEHNKILVFMFAQLTFLMLTKLPYFHTEFALFFDYIYFIFFSIILIHLRFCNEIVLVCQMAFQLLITSVIWFCGIINRYTSKDNKILIIVGIVCILFSWIQVFLSFKGKHIETIRRLTQTIINYKEIHVIVAIFVACSVSMLDFVPYNDSACYYSWNIKYLSDVFDFSTINVQWLMTINHFSNGYGLCALIGELILPHFTVGVHIINLILAALSIYCFYAIINEVCVPEEKACAIVGTAVFAFTPYMLGLIGEINVDIPVMYFFVIFLFCYVKKYFYLTIISGWFFVFSKEPAVIYYCCFWAGLVLLDIYRKRNVWRYPMHFTPVIFWGITFVSAKIQGVNFINNYIYRSGEKFNTFGFTTANAVLKLKEIFFLNFNWVYLILILLIVLHKKTYRIISAKAGYYFPLFTCFIGFLFFNYYILHFSIPGTQYLAQHF